MQPTLATVFQPLITVFDGSSRSSTTSVGLGSSERAAGGTPTLFGRRTTPNTVAARPEVASSAERVDRSTPGRGGGHERRNGREHGECDRGC